MMPYWVESWSNWLGVYAFAGVFAVLGPYMPRWLIVLLVISVWYVAQRSSVLMARRIGTAVAAVLASVMQLLFLLLCGWWSMRYPFPLWSWISPVVSAALLVGAFGAALAAERRLTEAVPRYGLESLLITCCAAAYLFVHFRSGANLIPALATVHFGILTVAVARNSRLVTEHLYGPVTKGAYSEQAWRSRLRQPAGLGAFLAALALPSGTLGVVLVGAEIGLWLVFHGLVK